MVVHFSRTLSCSNALVQWSPNGQFMAHVTQTRLTIRHADSLAVMANQVVDDDIGSLCWAPDSEFLAVGVPSLGLVHVFSPFNSDWTAKITQGAMGLSGILFSADSRHVLVWAPFFVSLTIWSLTSRKVKFIEHPKRFASGPDGALMAVVEKAQSGESLAWYRCSDWHLVKRVAPAIGDIEDLTWSPKSDSLVVWSGSLHYALQVFSDRGVSQFLFQKNTLELGIQIAQFSPCGQLLHMGTCDGRIRVFNTLNWTLVDDLELGPEINGSHTECVVYEESDRPVRSVDGQVIQDLLNLKETQVVVVKSRPVMLSEIPVDVRKPNPRIGIQAMAQSDDGFFLAVRKKSCPCVVFIWNLEELQLRSVFVCQSPCK
ncbi:WD repeat-containing protein WRAP73-like [Tigriopus californicus]|uniref:WD repeat-containing protein WRAP73-like n=1 Tax=Tigriopus californicus TaxID=6832 RepID=UPI0027DA875A|nr:WD repeat-containing protein WRAP73-like [Tigriopus californicus]